MLIFNELAHTYTHHEKKVRYKGATTFLKCVEHDYNEDFWSSYKAVEDILLHKQEGEYKWWILKDILKEIYGKGGTTKELDKLLEVERTEAINKYIEKSPFKWRFLTRKEQFIQQWNNKRDASCEKGTIEHKIREDSLIDELNGMSPVFDLDDLIERSLFQHPITELGDKMSLDIRELEFGKWYPEVILENDDLELCGTADLFKKERDGRYIIVSIGDWKTNEKIDVHNKFKTKLFVPVSHLDECNYNKYRLQLSFYYVLATMILGEDICVPGEVGFTHIDTLNNNKETKFMFPPLVKEVKQIIQMYGKRN